MNGWMDGFPVNTSKLICLNANTHEQKWD